jgi:hypothetical protein
MNGTQLTENLMVELEQLTESGQTLMVFRLNIRIWLTTIFLSKSSKSNGNTIACIYKHEHSYL